MKRLLMLVLGCWLAGAAGWAQTNVTLPTDVTLAVLKGLDFFRAQSATNDEGWLCHPIPGVRVIGYTNRVDRYREIEITIPGRKYEEYEVLVPGPSAGDPLRKEKRYRVVGLDPSKDTKETRLAYDTNGPIERIVQAPLYEKDAGCRWRYGGLGNNALAILALRRCGIAADDPLIFIPANNLAGTVMTYGWPDNLHDLAWLTAGFAVLPGEDFRKLTEQGASKLLDAQFTTGPAAGLWGPVAFNPTMAASVLKVLSRLGDDKKALQNELIIEQRKKSAAKAKRIEEEIQRIESRMESLQNNTRRITQLGLMMFDALGPAYMNGRLYLYNQQQYLGIEGLPYLAQNQIGADLESTALAILALRVAFENGRLPLKSWRPDASKPAPGAPPTPPDFPPARDARDVLTLAARAISAARLPNGQWPEMNFHQPVTDFAWLKSIPQVKPEQMPKLAQPVTLAGTVRGAAALANIQMIQTGAAKPTALEDAACRALLPDLYVGRPLANSNDVIRTPYNVLLQSTALRNLKGRCLRTDFNTWNEVADWLIGKQGKEGGWGRTSRWVFLPSTSLLALREALADMKPQDVANSYDKPHMSVGWLTPGHLLKYVEKEDAYFTAIALLFLADGLPEGWNPNTGR